MNNKDKFSHILNFKDFKGFKQVENIRTRYKIGKVLGEGSFGTVRIAQHRQADVKVAVKIIGKEKIEAHVLLDLNFTAAFSQVTNEQVSFNRP